MKHHTTTTAKVPAATVPFSGLGFDLTRTRACAQHMTPVIHRIEDDTISCAMFEPVFRPSGYALLTALSREIRGR